jgi:hypothetical protein
VGKNYLLSEKHNNYCMLGNINVIELEVACIKVVLNTYASFFQIVLLSPVASRYSSTTGLLGLLVGDYKSFT